MANKRQRIDPKIIDELLSDQDPDTVFSSEGLLGDLKKALAERILDAEMDVHLDSEQEQAAGNHRNGRSDKRVLTDTGALPLTISPDLVFAVTDAVHDEVNAWQSRPLEATYAIVFSDALRVKIRDEGAVRNKAVYLAIGMRCSGHKEILGLWIEQSEGAKFWLRVMSELKNRGTQDILIAVVDGLKGFPEAIESVFPQAEVQTCIVHLIRYSMQFASWKERKQVAKALKPGGANGSR